jgi:V/A-type H+-transporting ATPase subunit C
MAARLLRAGDAERLVECAQDECQSLLRRAGLARLLDDISGGHYLERSIVHILLDEVRILSRAAGEGREFLIHWARRLELTNLKALLRARLSQPPADVRSELIDLGPFATLPMEDLLRSEDPAELLRRLESTSYAGLARFARRAFEGSHQLFDLDAALDRRYYHGLVMLARPLEKSLGDGFVTLMSDLIDRVNLAWLLRYRFSYGLAPAQVYYLLIPGGYRLSGATLKYLSRLAGFEEVLAALPGAMHGWLARARTPHEVFRLLEARARDDAYNVLRSRAPAFARAFAYLLLRERDLRQVRAVLKGRHLGIPADTIRQALGVDDAEAGAESVARAA